MSLLRPFILAAPIALALALSPCRAAEPAAQPKAGELNTVCPLTGKPANPKITWEYEGKTYAFADEAARDTWKKNREESLYQRLGGKAAVNAAVDLFYKKMMADDRVKHVFDDVNMDRQIRKQKQFLSAAFGGPEPWKGMDLRTAHAGLGLTEAHFTAVAQNLQSSLEELKVPQPLVAEVMKIAGGAHDAVLNRPEAAATVQPKK
jgi:hemoglobin